MVTFAKQQEDSMEPITLCGTLIVIFGLWVEFEAPIMAVIRWVSKFMVSGDAIMQSSVQRPVYVGRLPICVAKLP